jgi:hypothetical protein
MPRRQLGRQVLWFGVAVTVLLLAYGLTDRLLTPPPGPTEANARRIRPGMTRAQVEALLGGPGDGFVGFRLNYLVTEPGCVRSPELSIYAWTGVEGVTEVFFASDDGPNDLVEDVRFEAAARPSLPQPIRSWFGR